MSRRRTERFGHFTMSRLCWGRERRRWRKSFYISHMFISEKMRLELFDILHLNSHSLIQQPLCERKEVLRVNFGSYSDQGIEIVSFDKTPTALEDLVQRSLANGCEGLVLKRFRSTYGCGQRNSIFCESRSFQRIG